MPWTGSRLSIVAFTARSVRSICDSEYELLSQLGFRCGAQPANHFWMGELGETSEEAQDACCHDFDDVFDRVNHDHTNNFTSANEMFKRMIARAAVWIANSARKSPRTRDHEQPGSSC